MHKEENIHLIYYLKYGTLDASLQVFTIEQNRKMCYEEENAKVDNNHYQRLTRKFVVTFYTHHFNIQHVEEDVMTVC